MHKSSSIRAVLLLLAGLLFMGVASWVYAFAETPSANAQEGVTMLHSDQGYMMVEHGISYHIESTPLDYLQAAGMDASSWTPVASKIMNLGAVADPVWLRFNVQNGEDKDSRWYMEIKWRFLDRIEVFLFDHSTQTWDSPITTKQSLSEEKPVGINCGYIFPLTIRAGAMASVYIRTFSDTKLIVPIELWQKAALRKSAFVELPLLGVIFGILSIMFIYDLLLYFRTGDRSFLSFSFFVFSLILYSLVTTGIGHRYVWDGSTKLVFHRYGFSSSLSFLSAAFFIRDYLRLKHYGGWLLHLNTFLVVLWSLLAGIYIVYTSPYIAVFGDILALFSCVAGLGTGIYCWVKKDPSARLFTIAWFLLVVTTNFLVISMLSMSVTIFFASFSQLVGFAIVVLLLSFALPERLNRERIAQAEAKNRALALSQKIAEEQAATLQFRQNTLVYQRQIHKKLEARIKSRTIELGQAMTQLEEANRELGQLNLIDSLTKVFNRRYFDQALLERARQAEQLGRHLAVALADIDHFKSINDTYGHLVGDACLERVAQTIRDHICPKTAMVARYGGEEFAIIMTTDDPEDAYQMTEKVRAAVENLVMENRRQTIDPRISIGVAARIPQSDELPEVIVQAADEALYQAKQAGRNRVVMAE